MIEVLPQDHGRQADNVCATALGLPMPIKTLYTTPLNTCY